MASRAMNFLRAAAVRPQSSRKATRQMSTSTTEGFMAQIKEMESKGQLAQFAPVSLVLGLVLVAVSFAAHTAKQHLANNPGVSVMKNRRGRMEEVDDPNRAAGQADRFINKSILRKVARIQDIDASRSGITDPTRPNPFTLARHVEGLNTVGVDARKR